MAAYVRPELPHRDYFDDDGQPIEYGNRWGGEPPPENAYSRTSHLERFDGVHVVAEALISWLIDTYDVMAEDGADVVGDFVHAPAGVVRAVRLTPRSVDGAPITFAFTDFPGVFVHAGALHEFHFPACGCDACDDNIPYLLDGLEWTVRTIVTGGYSESFSPLPGSWVEHSLDEPGVASSSGRSRAQDLPSWRVDAARRIVPRDGQWRAWPER